MTQRIVASAWWIVVMGIVTITAITAVLISYSGLLDLIAQKWVGGTLSILVGGALAITCATVCWIRRDLLV